MGAQRAACAESMAGTGLIENAAWNSGIPLGGIDCAKVDILTDGWLGNTCLGSSTEDSEPLRSAFLAVRAGNPLQASSCLARLRRNEEYANVTNISGITYNGLFPSASIDFHDEALPVKLSLEAWSALVPRSASETSLSAFFMEYTASNPASSTCDLALWLSFQDMPGFSDPDFYTFITQDSYAAVIYGETDTENLSADSFLIASPAANMHVSPVPVWDTNRPDLPFWSEFSEMGTIAPPGMEDAPPGGLLIRLSLIPSETRIVPFLILQPCPALQRSATETVTWLFQERERLHLESFAWREWILQSNLPKWLARDIINSPWPVIGRRSCSPSSEWLPGSIVERLAAQSFLLAMYPEVDSREITDYGELQSRMTPLADGRIPPSPDRLNAAVDECLLSSAAWIVQVVRHYRETGDRGLLHANYTNLCRAISWLQSADLDGDSLPEGRDGIIDSRPQSGLNNTTGGASITSAGLYLAALESAIEAAEALKDDLRAETYRHKLEAARNSVINHLWNGERFYKSYDNLEDQKDEGSTAAALLGEWAGGLNGLPSIYGRDIEKAAMEFILEAFIRPEDPLPPMELDAADNPTRETVIPWLLEILFGQEAIRQGYGDGGIVILQKLHEARWHRWRDLWGGAQQVTWPELQPIGGRITDGGMAAWNTLHALTGAAFDREHETLYLSPVLPSSQDSLHIPIFLNAFWGWLDYEPAEKILTIRIVRTFSPKGIIIQSLRSNGDAPIIPVSPAIPVETGIVADLWPYAEELGLAAKNQKQ